MKTMKKRIVIVLAAVCCFALAAFGFSAAFAAEESSFAMKSGASVRTKEPDGIRFTATIAEEEKTEEVNIGALVIPEKMLSEDKPLEKGNYAEALHFEGLDGVLKNGQYEFNVVIANIPVSQYSTALTAVFYMEKAGVTTYTETQTRSVKQVAEAALQSPTESTENKDFVVKYTFDYDNFYLAGTIDGKDLTNPADQSYRFEEENGKYVLGGVYLTAGDEVCACNPVTGEKASSYDVTAVSGASVTEDGISVSAAGVYSFEYDDSSKKLSVKSYAEHDNAPLVYLAGENNIYLAGTGADLYYTMKAFGESFVLKNGEEEISAENYRVNGERLTVAKEYLATLGAGKVTLTVVTANGSADFEVYGANRPTANEGSQNVTKFTEEVISDELLRVSADENCVLTSFAFVGAKSYDYIEEVQDTEESYTEAVVSEDGKSVSGNFGTITLNDENKSFDFDRAPGWFGTVYFTYTATDNNGFTSDAVTMDVVYKQRMPEIGEKDEKVFYKASGTAESADIVYTITNAEGVSDAEIVAIENGGEALEAGVDYTLGEKSGNYRYFTIKATYLATLDYGETVLTVYTAKGRNTISIRVVDKLSSADTGAMDKNAPQDVTFTLSGNPLSVASCSLDGALYTFDGETGAFTVKAAVADNFVYGENTVTVDNGYGALELKIDVSDSRAPELESEEITYLRNSSVGVKVEFVMYDKKFAALYQGENEVGASDYTFEQNVLTVSGAFIDEAAGEATSLELVAKMSDGTQIPFTVQIEESGSQPTVANTGDYSIARVNDVSSDVDLAGATQATLTYGMAEVSGEKWRIESGESGDKLVISGSYLNEIYRFGQTEYTFILSTEDGSVSFTVTYANAESEILNGGFETGTLYGWNAYSIWKNEEGMMAWTDDRVVNGGYFDQNYEYNKDGGYNLGIYGGSISKDSGQERMGILRSSDFVLGGSGWISFKLGGGKNSDFAYVSVKETATDKEVARFGNPNFGDTSKSGTLNAEAYLFQYYFDLTSVGSLGTSYYITLNDTASNMWCVLSADSFFTYYETAPNTDGGYLAQNILPEIQGVGAGSDTIVNGNFDAELTGWSDPSGIYKTESGYVISNNIGGDGATGVLRSSAFRITSEKMYIRFEWAGALKYDKQMFVSVKEVGTNIEVLRFVRRDNLSEKQNGDFDNHLLDLSSLPLDKEYYIELADNTDVSWGVFKADNFRLIDAAEYNGITSGDRAVSISGINTDFKYELPYNV